MDGIYCGPPPLPDELWSSWNFDIPLLLALAMLGLVARHRPAGLLAVGVLFIAFVSPLCAWSAALFSARVVHHVLLVAFAAPLVALAFPARQPSGPALPFIVSTVVLWAWHVPVAYDLALSNMVVYWAMQLSLLGSAVWFWRSVLSAAISPVDQILFIVASFAQMGMLGAILTFASTSLYAVHAVAPFDWGMTPLSDQQLGGLIMWVPSAVPYAIAAAMIARRRWSQLSGGTA